MCTPRHSETLIRFRAREAVLVGGRGSRRWACATHMHLRGNGRALLQCRASGAWGRGGEGRVDTVAFAPRVPNRQPTLHGGDGRAARDGDGRANHGKGFAVAPRRGNRVSGGRGQRGGRIGHRGKIKNRRRKRGIGTIEVLKLEVGVVDPAGLGCPERQRNGGRDYAVFAR
jgi:hypothetical protein